MIRALYTAASGKADMHAEVLVLGAGPGGYTAAFRAADLGKKVVLRSDGTSVYITQDVGTTVRKAVLPFQPSSICSSCPSLTRCRLPKV